MLHAHEILISIALGDVLRIGEGVEIRLKRAIAQARAEEARRCVPQVSITLGAAQIVAMERAVADVLAPRCDGSIVIGIFQGFAQTLFVLVGRHIAQRVVVAQTAIFPAFGSGAQQARELLRIGRLVNSTQDGFHDDGHGVITDHHVRFAGKHVPHGEVTLVLRSKVHHRLHHVFVVIGCNEVVERMGSAVGVPQGEGAVVLLPLCQAMHLAVCPEVSAIDIAIQRGTEVGMIEGGVEDAPLC